jgi:hypothetical protein
LLAELEPEARWDSQFFKSQDMLSRMAREAIKEDKQGKTRPLDEILDVDNH